ncbi:tRNA (adenosine(37)-N6)-threonylcarbamoyltransferase complex dimerization subunit type 1 TsaB [Aliiroseovarius subalbicans]|uniref:tRNA (adenosine(37)-N6)-threonylcarbamoyltransferase complex dimerization subunit type 1 TsaB n=1 Tax=Aliiroseovarius subalbicans TaxID=2925840 RepID=UPI001F5846F0|nr:tRNA (adenosine(37)-N6)-threonylcarbamoyltransferase complex dimerization subunit type 1 TsaB [Aliiroseovarius subalbicans]MCI2400460.1 tRNA (adenosine(37)-N6)-threonylcarbamoyltransferase complex dimerization subunit type 1 TsaB [Aliiroseovarius subalbicans]
MRPDPLILAFDTSAAHCAAALLSGDRVIVNRHEDMGRGQAERLMPLLEEVLAEGGATWRDLAAIGVGIGPGNFTGIRISVAAARGLALSLGVPAVGVSTLEAQAHGQTRPVWSLVDARRDHLYAQHLGIDPAPAVIPASDAADLSPVIGPHANTALPSAIARIAAARLAQGGDIPRPAPLYVRAADAAPPRDPAPVILP